ncbi:MAG: FecR family protein [Bacteroidetes bacterium]|nr:FecR family protein [Bacteroidota bacterium]
MHQKAEGIQALLLDNRFVDWVVNPQSPYGEYWHQWMETSEGNRLLAEEARSFLLDMRRVEAAREQTLHEETIGNTWETIRSFIGETREEVKGMQAGRGQEPVQQGEEGIVAEMEFRQHSSRRRWSRFMAAASIGLVLLAGLYLLTRQDRRQPPPVIAAASEAPASQLVRYNGNEKNELFFLPDGSRITLAKGARVTYSRLMSGQRREVSLEGEAFFDIAKNPQKPFYIYTQNMVIKVLGTSFRVNASTGKESVAVSTGKVSVYLKGQDLEQSAARILLPRDMCTYSVSGKELIKSVYTSTGRIELKTESRREYSFEDAPLDSVFSRLEKMYALPVHYDRQTFSNCFLTISLGNESLEEKLEIITRTVGASFSMSENGINIEGKGCK